MREFIRAHGERIGDISIYGQKLDDTTWRLVKVNLAIRRIKDRTERGDSFFTDCFPDLIVAHSKISKPKPGDWTKQSGKSVRRSSGSLSR